MSKITDKVTQLSEPVISQLGLILWDVQFVKEAGGHYLRIYIDKPGGVGISDCEAVSRALDPLLDEHDPIPMSYTFEVSSAGAERELKCPSDFEMFIGELVEVKFYQPINGSKTAVGNLVAYEDGAVTIEQNGEVRRYEKSQVAQTRLRMKI